MNTNEELLHEFYRRRRYRLAPAWQKPWLDPSRFLRNQLFKHSAKRPAGELTTVETFHLRSFTVVNGENVSEEIRGYGIYEHELTEAFLKLVQPGQVVLDVGMHLGYYTTLFARLVGLGGEVHAFEPTPSTREIAANNVRPFPQVQVHPFAVWSSVGQLEFHDYGLKWMAFNSCMDAGLEEGAPAGEKIQVTTTTLDRVKESILKPIALIKLDAESAEREILAGASKLLQTDRPIISMEVGDREGKPSSRGLIETLEGFDYRPWEFKGGEFRVHAPLARYGYDNLLFAHKTKPLEERGL